jgi:hypothetical protein
MMEKRNDVAVACAIETLELIGHPGELQRVTGDVRIERDEEAVPVPEGVRRISTQPPRRTFFGHELRERGQRVVQAHHPVGIAERHAGHVVIAGREEKRHAAGTRQAFDDRREADVPLRAVGAAQDGVARLQDEPDRVGGARRRLDALDYQIGDLAVNRMHNVAVAGQRRLAGRSAGAPRVAVRDERELRLVRRHRLRRQRTVGGLDRPNGHELRDDRYARR